MGPPDAVHTFPSDDEEFRLVVHDVVARRQPGSPGELRDLLSGRYPDIDVRERAPLGAAPTDDTVVWYAFRHGTGRTR